MPEHKIVPFELTKVDATGRTFEGYASTFGNLDQVGDVVVKGAFAKTLSERGRKIKILWQHDPSEPIGRPTELREDDKGLWIKGIISDTARGRDALTLLKDGAIDSMSIGYDAVPGGIEYQQGKDGKAVRLLKEIKLWEVSLVSFPANTQARVLAVKAKPFEVVEMTKEYRSELTRKGLWDAGNRTADAFHDAIDTILADESLEGAAKLSLVAESCAQFGQAIGDWAARLIAVSGKSAGEPAECKAGRRHSTATRAAIQAAIKVLNDLIEEAAEPDEEAACDDDRRPRKDDEKSTDVETPVEPGPTESQEIAGGDSAKAGPGVTPPTAEAAAGPGATPPTSSEPTNPVVADIERWQREIVATLEESQ